MAPGMAVDARHDVALLLAAGVAGVVWIVTLLYRREGRALHPLSRWSLIGLRLLVLLGVLTMLLEPVLVFRKTEFVPSNLIVLSDASDSMDLRDAFVDPQRAAATATALKLKGGVNRTPTAFQT